MRRARGERLVQVERRRSPRRAGPDRAQRGRRVRRERGHRAVGRGRDAVAERRHERLGRRPVARARAPAPRGPAPAATRARPEHLALHATRDGEAVRADEADAHRPRPYLRGRPAARLTPARYRPRPMPDAALPALSLVATPGKRQAILDLAAEAERRGFAGIACPSLGSAIEPVRVARPRHRAHPVLDVDPADLPRRVRPRRRARPATSTRCPAAGSGSASASATARCTPRLGVQAGRPLADMQGLRRPPSAPPPATLTPPIYLATMRDRMLALAVEIARGRDLGQRGPQRSAGQLTRVPGAAEDGFFRANMIPTVIDDDRAAADAVNRRTMTGYVTLPNYRNYWKRGRLRRGDGGHRGRAGGRRARPAAGADDRTAGCTTCTLSGSAAQVREGSRRGPTSASCPSP